MLVKSKEKSMKINPITHTMKLKKRNLISIILAKNAI